MILDVDIMEHNSYCFEKKKMDHLKFYVIAIISAFPRDALLHQPSPGDWPHTVSPLAATLSKRQQPQRQWQRPRPPADASRVPRPPARPLPRAVAAESACFWPASGGQPWGGKTVWSYRHWLFFLHTKWADPTVLRERCWMKWARGLIVVFETDIKVLSWPNPENRRAMTFALRQQMPV